MELSDTYSSMFQRRQSKDTTSARRLKLSRCPFYKVTQSTLIAVTVPLERPEIKCFA